MFMLTLSIHACDTFSIEELEKLILEEQILAEVEKIMEMGTTNFLRCMSEPIIIN